MYKYFWFISYKRLYKLQLDKKMICYEKNNKRIIKCLLSY